MPASKQTTLAGRFAALTFDERARLVGLYNKATRTQLITFREASEAWRLVLRTGRHTVEFALGSQQRPPRVKQTRVDGGEQLTFAYNTIKAQGKALPIRCRFQVLVRDDDPAIEFRAQIDNRSTVIVEEVEFPIAGGMGGFPQGKQRIMHLVFAQHRGGFYDDVLHQALPSFGGEGDQFSRALQTAMFGCGGFPDRVGNSFERDGAWMELWSPNQGLYAGIHLTGHAPCALKLEKHPKETPHGPRGHAHPPTTPRWLRFAGLQIAQIQPGKTWQSQPVMLMPHKGDWHVGADRFAQYRREGMVTARPPAWLDDFVGWTEILGKTYLGEVFHDYRRCAQEVIRDADRTGIRFVFYYGHTAIGAEGADLDNGPAADLGGEKGFRAMVKKLHDHGIRIMLLDHLHRYVNRDLPEFKRLDLQRFARRDRNGQLVESRWGKETALSCMHRSGPTPVWIEMCPACEGWQHIYLKHLTRMVQLGVDALELDLYWPFPCFSADHGHAVGEDLFQTKLAFMRRARAHVQSLNPDFALFAEDLVPENREAFDGFYPSGRYGSENERIFRYMFPELGQQAVRTGNYAYDQVNKALQLGIGVETEIWGLRQTCARGCPELADYIGQINRYKRRYPQLLINGVFRDTVGGRVTGPAFYSLFQARDGGLAMVLRNPHKHRIQGNARFLNLRGRKITCWQPGRAQRRVKQQPYAYSLAPQTVAVLIAHGQ